MPDYSKAKLAIAKLFQLYDRVPPINNWPDKKGIMADDKTMQGEIRFEDVEFSYPTRQEQQILNKLNLSIQQGKRIALVGASGCGKTSVLNIIYQIEEKAKHLL